MTPQEKYDFVVCVLSAHDEFGWGSIFVRVCDGEVQADVNCNDLFYWGCSDSEELTPNNIDSLWKTAAEVKEITEDDKYACDLWASRQRRMRPQGCCYPEDRRLWPLFDACGPEREKGLGNPYAPGERERNDVRREKHEREQLAKLKAKYEPH